MLSAPRLTRFVFGALVCCAALLQSGCAGTYTGGGFIDSAIGAPAKATFGFNMRSTDGITAGGQFQYNDHGTGVVMHERPNTLEGFAFIGNLILVGNAYVGGYSSQAGNGTVLVGVTADHDPFGNPVDFLVVLVMDGPYAGYFNAGTVQGGNIQYHPPHP
jgi:hypothetical protein